MGYKYKLSDIKNLKQAKAPGRVFALIIIGVCLLVTLYIFVLRAENYVFWTGISLFIGIILSLLIYYVTNRAVIKDLNENDFFVITSKIIDKRVEIDYEAGSGALFIPILGNILPKRYGATMRPFEKNMFYLENGKSLNLDKEIYDKYHMGDIIDILYSKNAAIFLRIEKSKK